MRTGWFWIAAAAVGLALVALTRLYFTNEYFFFAAYVVLYFKTDQGEELLEHAVGVRTTSWT